MAGISRRIVLRTSVGAVTAGSYSRILGANERVQVAVIGTGARGAGYVRSLRSNTAVTVTGLCDIYGRKVEAARQFAPEAAVFSDHRRVLEMKNLDAVFIATPDHWHVPISLDAVSAGKDVYCEKPVTLKIGEGAALQRAVRAGKRVFQSGMQQRSMAHYKIARDEYVKAGKLGHVTFVRTWWHGSIGSFVRPVPPELEKQRADLDWKRFVAPVDPKRPYQPYQYNCFRAFLDFGGGQFTDLFAHWVDVAHMVMGEDIPAAASAVGGVWIPEYQHDGSGRTAPDTVSAHLTYPGGWTCTFDATLAAGIDSAGVEFYGTQGRLFITRSGFEFTPVDKDAQAAYLRPGGGRGVPRGPRPPGARGVAPAGEPFSLQPRRDPNTVAVRAEGSDQHINNFLDCIKTRKDPNATVEDGIRAALASHLCTLSYLQNRRLRFDPVKQRVIG